jgi:hypothetical protein
MRLYLDMDGVLMDYDQHILKWLNPPWTGRTYHHLPHDQWTAEETANDQRYKDAMADPEFWATMPPMADAHLLWHWCKPYQPHILTATPANATYRDRCANDKFRSIWTHFDPVFPTSNFWAVLRSEKRLHAGSHENGDRAILVDDMVPNCQEWQEAGGIAILHTDAISTIRKLEEILHV